MIRNEGLVWGRATLQNIPSNDIWCEMNEISIDPGKSKKLEITI